MRPVLVVANGAAGTADDDRLDAALHVLRRGGEVELVRTGSQEEIDGLLARRGKRRIVVAGGDGSLHAVVAALHRRGELAGVGALGVVPLGTGNDFACALGLPLDPGEAAGVVLNGRDRSLDLLVDDAGGVVVNAVHAGIGADAARAAGNLKDRLGKAAYPLGSVVAGATARGWRLRVEVDGAVLADGDEPLLMVGLGNGTSIGGGAQLTPDAAPDDGLVDVVVSASTGAMARIGYALALSDAEHVDREDVVLARGRVVTVSGEDFPVNADGELQGQLSRRTWTVLPGAWSVRVPGVAG